MVPYAMVSCGRVQVLDLLDLKLEAEEVTIQSCCANLRQCVDQFVKAVAE